MNEIPEVSLGYESNRFGYRCDEFDRRAELNIIFIGDEWTEGVGLDRDHTYPQLSSKWVAQQTGLSVNNWNMGHRNKGYDYVSRTLACAVPILKPDLVIITFASLRRREFFGLDGNLIDFGSHSLQEIRANPDQFSSIERDLQGHWSDLDSRFDDLASAILNYKLCEEILNAAAIPWGYSFNDEPDAAEPVKLLKGDGWFNSDHDLKIPFQRIDQVEGYSDLPGVNSHMVFAEGVGRWILEHI